MSQISLKSLSGITSITTPAGVDNQLTIHTNDTTQRVKVTQSGIDVTGVVTATTFSGDGSNLTGLAADKIFEGDTKVEVVDSGSQYIVAEVNGGEKLRIDSSGRVLIGRSASRMVGGSTTYAKLQVAGTSQSDSSISVVNNENSTAGAFLFFGKTRGNAVGSSTIVQNGDTLGGLSFIGADGNDTNNRTAEITAVVNGGPGNNEIPTDLTFSTSPTHAGSLVERMRIYSTGRILIGNGASEGGPSGNLDIVGDINGDGGELYLRVSNNNSVDNIGALSFGNNVDRSVVSIKGHTHTANNTGDLTFHTSTTGTMSEKVRITNAGRMGVGVVAPKSVIHTGAGTDIRVGGQYGGSSRFQLQKAYDSGYTGTHWQFRTDDGISWSFDGVLIVHGTGGSTYGSEVVNIKIVYSRESGQTNSGDTWRNGSVDYNIETLEHGQVGLAPSSGDLTVSHDSNPGGATGYSLLKLGWSSSGQSVGVWSKLIGTLYWGAPSGGEVKIQDKDATTYINSNP